MNTFTTQDGFTWYILQPKVAKYLHDAEYCEIYELHDDESESLCEQGHKFSNDVRYAIEYPSQHKVHALCGAKVIKWFEEKKINICHHLIFNYGIGDLTFFSPFAKPKDVIDHLSGCSAVKCITPNEFLKIITND